MSKGISTLLAFFFAVAAAWAQDRPTLYAQRDHGIPATPYEVTYQQPNGQTVRVNLKGDGAAHWAITPDGYKLVKNQEGAFCYAVEDATKGMKASNIIASDISSRTSLENTLLKSLNKSITYNPTYIERKKASRSLLKAGEKPQKAFPTKGNRKLLCILVSYQDIKFQKTQAEFNDLFNKQGYNTNNATGSVRDYFYDNSFQQMNLTVDVVGPVTVSQSRASYGGNDANGNDINPEAMVTEAVKLADQSGVDFSQYDNDKDGTIDGVYVIFAGNGEEAGASAEAIWSHAWQIPTLTLDGVKISAYSCSPELYGTSKTTITSIGVICHEFSHVCGLPDYYDTDYGKSGGESENLGDFDIMAGGSWNNNGKTPPFTNSYSRYMLGWGELKNFNNKNLNTITPHYSTPYGYWTSTKSNEWFVFENRQQTKWDTYIPGHGMVVYHVVYDAARWGENTINVNPAKELFMLVDAKTPANSTYSPFPGDGNVKTLSATTTPAIKNWDGSSLNTSLTNITENNGNITLDVNAIQFITFTIQSEGAPLANAIVLIDGKSYTSNSAGVVSNVEVKLYGSRTFSVSKTGYQTYNGSITTENNTSISVILYSITSKSTITVKNGNTQLPNVIVKMEGNTYTTNASGSIIVPSISGTINAEIVIGANNSFKYDFTLVSGGETIINLKKIIAIAKSRIGDLGQINLTIPNYAQQIVDTYSQKEFYVPYVNLNIPYSINFSNGLSESRNLTINSKLTDTIKINYNKYDIYTAQQTKTIPNITVNVNGRDYTSNENGKFSLIVPMDITEINFEVNTNGYFKTSQTLNNQTTSSSQYQIKVVNSQQNNSFTVAPNPVAAADPLNIYSKVTAATAYIYNLNGSLLQTAKLSLGQNTVDRSMLNSGVYLVKIESSEGTFKTKIVIL